VSAVYLSNLLALAALLFFGAGIAGLLTGTRDALDSGDGPALNRLEGIGLACVFFALGAAIGSGLLRIAG